MTPHRAVILCSSPRTGSGVLCSALWSTDLCGRPDEYLDRATRTEHERTFGTSGDREYAAGVFKHATTANGVFSLKVHSDQLHRTSWIGPADARGRVGVAVLRDLAPEVHFYWLRRRDKVQQAVSMYVRRATGNVRLLEGEPRPTVEQFPFDYDEIRRGIERAEEWDRDWARGFEDAGVSPASLWYEDDIEHLYVDTTRSILAAIGVERPSDVVITSNYRKQADEVSRSLEQRYRAVQRRDARRGGA